MELIRFAIAQADGVRVFGIVGADHEGVYALEQAWASNNGGLYGFLWDIKIRGMY